MRSLAMSIPEPLRPDNDAAPRQQLTANFVPIALMLLVG
jgi:hypothetical protein